VRDLIKIGEDRDDRVFHSIISYAVMLSPNIQWAVGFIIPVELLLVHLF
jgi:hypothetical protein